MTPIWVLEWEKQLYTSLNHSCCLYFLLSLILYFARKGKLVNRQTWRNKIELVLLKCILKFKLFLFNVQIIIKHVRATEKHFLSKIKQKGNFILMYISINSYPLLCLRQWTRVNICFFLTLLYQVFFAFFWAHLQRVNISRITQKDKQDKVQLQSSFPFHPTKG